MKQDRNKTEERRHVFLYGTVQGVGFRYFVRQAAHRLDLAGYVRNRPDGSVELEASGAADGLAELIHTVEHGPPLSNVERLENRPPTADPLPRPFAIVH